MKFNGLYSKIILGYGFCGTLLLNIHIRKFQLKLLFYIQNSSKKVYVYSKSKL